MRLPRSTLLGAMAAAGLLALPAGVAQAATLDTKPSQRCYGTGDRVSLVGTGFTPSKSAVISRDGRRIGPVQTNAKGALAALATVPSIRRATQTSTYRATDRADPAIVATKRVQLSRLSVRVAPGDSEAQRPRRIRARGFTTGGGVLYAHIVRGETRRLVTIGRLRGACKTVDRVRRLFGAQAKAGSYKVQFDTFRAYRRDRAQRVGFEVQIERSARSGASSSDGDLRVAFSQLRR